MAAANTGAIRFSIYVHFSEPKSIEAEQALLINLREYSSEVSGAEMAGTIQAEVKFEYADIEDIDEDEMNYLLDGLIAVATEWEEDDNG
jgi:hypothetical protein